MMDFEWPLGMILFSLILHHNMGMKYAEEALRYGYVFLPKASLKNGYISDPQHTHPGIFILESPPPPPPGGDKHTPMGGPFFRHTDIIWL